MGKRESAFLRTKPITLPLLCGAVVNWNLNEKQINCIPSSSAFCRGNENPYSRSLWFGRWGLLAQTTNEMSSYAFIIVILKLYIHSFYSVHAITLPRDWLHQEWCNLAISKFQLWKKWALGKGLPIKKYLGWRQWYPKVRHLLLQTWSYTIVAENKKNKFR